MEITKISSYINPCHVTVNSIHTKYIIKMFYLMPVFPEHPDFKHPIFLKHPEKRPTRHFGDTDKVWRSIHTKYVP